MDKNLLHVWYMNSLAGYSVATYIIGIDPKFFKMMLVVYNHCIQKLCGISGAIFASRTEYGEGARDVKHIWVTM